MEYDGCALQLLHNTRHLSLYHFTRVKSLPLLLLGQRLTQLRSVPNGILSVPRARQHESCVDGARFEGYKTMIGLRKLMYVQGFRVVIGPGWNSNSRKLPARLQLVLANDVVALVKPGGVAIRLSWVIRALEVWILSFYHKV